MPLKSLLFQGNGRLEACLVNDAAHVVPGSVGQHVVLIQDALRAIDGLDIDLQEAESKLYGSTTAAAVLAYKTRRRIINRSYQTKEDNIVGKMTIKSLDDDLSKLRAAPPSNAKIPVRCVNNTPGDRPKIATASLPPQGVTGPTRVA